MSIVAGRINSYSIVKSFLASAMQSAAKNDAFRADTFIKMVTLKLVSFKLFFSFKKLQKGCLNARYFV